MPLVRLVAEIAPPEPENLDDWPGLFTPKEPEPEKEPEPK